MFTGLSAFPLTPLTDDGIDQTAFAGLITRLADAGVDSIGALGSTGSYAYLERSERAWAARAAVEHAGGIPVMIGVGAFRTRQVLELTEDAQNAGAAALLLAPVSYQPLTQDEVFGLYETVTAHASVPVVVYENSATTHFTFTDELHARIAALPGIGAIKIPGIAADEATARIDTVRSLVPSRVAIGVSGDWLAAGGLAGGADVWFSVLGGLFPVESLAITRASAAGDTDAAREASARFEPLWVLFRQHGSLRVISAAAEILGLVDSPNLPLPVRGLDAGERERVQAAIRTIGLLA